MPLLDPELLAEHPFTVVGNWLEHAPLAIDPATPGLNLVGWVPDLRPYVERSRVACVCRCSTGRESSARCSSR